MCQRNRISFGFIVNETKVALKRVGATQSLVAVCRRTQQHFQQPGAGRHRQKAQQNHCSGLPQVAFPAGCCRHSAVAKQSTHYREPEHLRFLTRQEISCHHRTLRFKQNPVSVVDVSPSPTLPVGREEEEELEKEIDGD